MKLARRAYEGLGGALSSSFDVPGTIATYQKMFEVAKVRNDLSMQVSALNKRGFVAALMQGQVSEAEQHLGDAEQLARASDDLPGLAECHMTYCYIRTATGDFEDAVGHLSESAQIGRDLDLEEPKLFGLTHSANTLTYMTQFEEAWEKAQEARQLAEELGNQKWLAELMVLSTSLHYLRNGDLDAAFQSAEEGTTLAARIGAADNECEGAIMLGQLSWMRGDYQRAIAYQQQGLEAGRTAGFPYLQASALCALGTVYLDISDDFLAKTNEYHTQALEIIEMPLGTVMGGYNWAEIGFCAMATGDLEKADALFQKGLTTPSAVMHLARPQLLIGSAFVALGHGNIGDAVRLIREAQEFADERAMKNYYPFVALAGGQVSATRGETDQALKSFTRAEELGLGLRMRPLVVQARAAATKLLSTLGRTSEAEEKQGQARAMIDKIAALFQDEQLRSKYAESATKKLG